MKWEVAVGPDGLDAALDRELQKVIGVNYFEYKGARSVSGNMPMRLFTCLVQLVDESGVLERLHEWDAQQRSSNVGRKAIISFRAVLVIDLMTAFWSKGVQYREVADTIIHRLTVKQLGVLGITRKRQDEGRWYDRHWAAKNRLLKLIDPYHHTKKNRSITLAEFAQAEESKDEEREERMRWLLQALVNASVGMLPQRYRDAYTGDVALDSTRIRVQGRVHSKAFTAVRNGLALDHPRVVQASRTLRRGGVLTNVDFTAGNYKVRGSGGFEPAHELDFVTMMDTTGYAKHPAFARLITAMSIHVPGAITGGPRLAMQAHSRTFSQRGICAADRAFTNSEAKNLQLPLRQEYWEFAWDYPKDEFGDQGRVPGKRIIVVDGGLYVDYMPEHLINATSLWKNGKPNPATGQLYTWAEIQLVLEERRDYELKRHGSLVSEGRHGAQRFMYPDPATYKAFDPATGNPVPPNKNKLRGSVRIRPHADFVRKLQRYPWGTAEWQAAYGQRNQVESSNANIKRPRFENIGDPQLRSGRGVAYHGLASAIMVIAFNIRAIVSALVAEHRPLPTPKRVLPGPMDTPTWMLGGPELDALEPPDEVDEVEEAA